MKSQEQDEPRPVSETESTESTTHSQEEETPENTADRDAVPTSTENHNDDVEGITSTEHDGWCSCWDETLGAWYFHNTATGETTWENPYGENTVEGGEGHWPGTTAVSREQEGEGGSVYGYDPNISTDPFGGLLDHVDRVKAALDGPSEEVVLPSSSSASSSSVPWTGYYPSLGHGGQYGGPTEDRYRTVPEVHDSIPGEDDYTVRAHFNTRTGKFQPIERVIEDPRDRFSQTAKAERQCGVYFDYGSWAQMKGEKGGEGKVTVRSRKEIQILRQKKKEKKEQKRKAFFAD